MQKIKVSVIIYVLNDAIHIEKCIHSVLSQTLKEIEVLVIDGGSDDGTKEIIESILPLDSRIRMISCESGVGLQFNTGLLEAKGEYIGICESDDYILPDMYKKQYEIVNQYQLDILRADANHFFEIEGIGEITFPSKLSNLDELYNCVIYPQEDTRILKLGVNGFWSGLYRREFLLDQKIFMNETKGATYQDTSFSFLSMIKAKRVMLSKEAFYCYRLDNPKSSVNNPKKLDGLLEEYRLLKLRLISEGVFEKYKEVYWEWKLGGCNWFYGCLSENIKNKYIDLIYCDICQDLEEKEYKGSELGELVQEFVEHIKISKDNFEEYMVMKDLPIRAMDNELNKIPRDAEVIIFGSGIIGNLVCLYMIQNKRNVRLYIDNDNLKWGKKLSGIVIIEPEQAVKLYTHGFYVIANAKHCQEMKEQLLKLCINEHNIITCDNYNVLKNVLIDSVKASK